MPHACAHCNVIVKIRQNQKTTSGALRYPSHVSTTMKKIVGLLMFKWVTLEIWRKLFLEARNLHAQVCRNLWDVESNLGIFICINPFFYCPIFIKKKFTKLKLNIFFRVSIARSEKIARFLSLVFHM
jgi:hypothetical protein